MLLSKFVRFQLVAFALLTIIGLVWMGASFVRVPQMLGVGRVVADVELDNSGGLYKNSNVTYRGKVVGVVDEVRLTRDHAVARINIDANAEVPANVRADVHSMSAVGEQYVELTPAEGASGDARLVDGGTIPVSRTSVPSEIGPMLDQATKLLASIDDVRLKRVIDEAFVSFDGAGPELQTLVDSMRLLLQEAEDNTEATQGLIDGLGPLLDTQSGSAESIRTWTRSLATVTGTLRAKDPVLRDIMAKTPAAAAEVTRALEELNPTWPILMANLVSIGEVGIIYNKSIEQLLVVFPPLVSALITAVNNGRESHAIKADFNLNVHDPAPCTTGFLPGDQRRSPKDLSVPETPDGLFCKVPQDSDIAVRGVRNYPCMEFPGRRGPSPEACRRGDYTPMGVNPQHDGEVNPNGAPTTSDGTRGTAPASVTTSSAKYDPSTGNYVASDGNIYSQANLAADGGKRTGSLASLLTNGEFE